MRVLIIEPNRGPYVSEINSSLKSMQKIVGGLIEPINIDESIVLVVNEEGKLLELEGNRSVGSGIIAGTFFICGLDTEGEFASLTEEQIKKYYDRFKEPEHYTSEEVEDSIFIEVCGYGSEEEMDDDLEV